MERRRLRRNLIETFKILTGKEYVNRSRFFELADVTSGLKRSVVEITQTKMSYDSPTEVLQFTDCQRVKQATAGRRGRTVTFKNRLDRYWHYNMAILS